MRWVAVAGLLLAFAGLSLAVVAHWRHEPRLFAETKTVREEVVDAASKFVDKLRGKQPPAPGLNSLRVAATVLGLLGLLAGTAGWIRREDHRLCGAAAAVGVAAVAWQWVLAGIVIAVVLLIIGGITASLG